MESLAFLKQYFINPRTVGAVFPSSDKLACKMIENINFLDAKYIIEYGSGTGVFTEKLLNGRNKETIIIAFEYNRDFYDILKDKYNTETNLYLINDSAEHVEKYLKIHDIKEVDYVVSGLPFASLPKDVSVNILNATKRILKEDGKFITFQYTLFKKKFMKEFFPHIEIKAVLRNIPPAHVFCCNNGECKKIN